MATSRSLARCKRARTALPPPPPIVYEAAPGQAVAPLSTSYRRREPDKTVLYQFVARELASFVEAIKAQSDYGHGLPGYIEKELLAYLDCGILANGFARIACRDCHREMLVAFSCRGRGLCPSCTTRRMHDTAAHLVDRVIPRVPMRQWVLTFSPRVRWHLAEDPKLASEALSLCVRALWNFQRRRARRAGIRLPRAHGHGAITFVQRFGSALQLALHFHTLMPDGVFVPPPGADPEARPRFHRLDPPTQEEVEQLLKTIIRRVTRLLEKRGRFEQEPDPDDARLCAYALASRSPVKSPPTVEEDLPPLCARIDGFSLHAASVIHENDRAGLERLCRYGARPPLSLGRLTQLDDGTLVYRMKRTFSDGTREIHFTPQELLARLCALIPPARVHLTRYHGIFAPRARRRAALTGRKSKPRTAPADKSAPAAAAPPPSPPPPSPSPPAQSPSSPPSIGDLPPAPEREVRLPWADLLRRVHQIDVKRCSACGGPVRVVAYLTDPDVTKRILDHLRLPSTAPPRGPPRHPPPRRPTRPPPPPTPDLFQRRALP